MHKNHSVQKKKENSISGGVRFSIGKICEKEKGNQKVKGIFEQFTERNWTVAFGMAF